MLSLSPLVSPFLIVFLHLTLYSENKGLRLLECQKEASSGLYVTLLAVNRGNYSHLKQTE